MKKILALATLFLSFFTNANEWSGYTTVEDIIVGYSGKQFMFTTAASIHNPNNNCNTGYYAVSPEHASSEQILSVLLTAQSRGSQIQIGVDTTNCGPLGNYVRVLKVRLRK